jgi:hypothetical protein
MHYPSYCVVSLSPYPVITLHSSRSCQHLTETLHPVLIVRMRSVRRIHGCYMSALIIDLKMGIS